MDVKQVEPESREPDEVDKGQCCYLITVDIQGTGKKFGAVIMTAHGDPMLYPENRLDEACEAAMSLVKGGTVKIAYVHRVSPIVSYMADTMSFGYFPAAGDLKMAAVVDNDSDLFNDSDLTDVENAISSEEEKDPSKWRN